MYILIEESTLLDSRLSLVDKVVYSIIFHSKNRKYCYSYAKIADLIGVSVKTISRSIANLEKLNLVSIEYRRNAPAILTAQAVIPKKPLALDQGFIDRFNAVYRLIKK